MAVLDPGATLSTFALIVPAELPDKTFIATLILATRFRHLPVWLGVSAAFFVQTAIAVSLGGLLSLLPRALVAGVAAVIFAAGAAILFKGAMKSRQAAKAEAEALVAEERSSDYHKRYAHLGMEDGDNVLCRPVCRRVGRLVPTLDRQSVSANR